MRWKSVVAVAALSFAVATLSACSALKPDPSADTVAAQVFDDLRLGRMAAVQARLTPEAKAVVTPAQVEAVRAYAPRGAPLERRAINWSTFIDASGPQTATMAYELRYPDEGVLYSLTLKRPNAAAPWGVESFNLNRASNAELARGKLQLTGKPPGQWAFLAMTVLSPVLMLLALVAVLRGPKMKRKWLWAIVALAGIGSAQMNWTTSQWGFQILSIQLIGAGVTKTGFLGFFPWLLKFTVPVGAVAALWRVRKARKAQPRLDEAF